MVVLSRYIYHQGQSTKIRGLGLGLGLRLVPRKYLSVVTIYITPIPPPL